MCSTYFRFASKIFIALFATIPLQAAVDANWNTPEDGAIYAQATTAAPYNSVPFSIDVEGSIPAGYYLQIYSGNSLLGSLGLEKIVAGRRTFGGRIGISNTGSYLLTAKMTDGFTEIVFDGPTITVANSAPPTTFIEVEPTQITAVSAILNGKVDSHGRARISGFSSSSPFNAWEGSWEIGTSTSYGTNVGGGHTFESYLHYGTLVAGQAFVRNLQPSTTYHYRFVGVGMVGPDQTFTTQPNNPPLLRDDYGILDRSGISDIDVLQNDEDEKVMYWNLPKPVVEISQQPQDGVAQVSQIGNPLIRYTAGPSFSGVDEFTYLVRDSFGGESTAKVRIFSPGKFYPTVAGHYSGATLYQDQHLHTVNVSVTSSGELSGMLNYFGAQMPFTGRLRQTVDNGPEAAFIYLPRPGFPPLRLFIGLALDTYNSSIPILYLSVWDEAFGREIEFYGLAAHVTARDLVPEAGSFNVTMQNSEAAPLDTASPGTLQTTVKTEGNPQGHGFSRMRVSKNGKTIVWGKTGDHTPFTSGATLRRDRSVQLKSRLGTAKKSKLIGLVGFNAAQAKASGELRWLNPARPSGAYLNGFDLNLPADAKKVSKPPQGEGILLFPEGSEKLVKVSVGNHDGNLLASATMPLVKGKLDNGPGKSFRLRLSVNEKTGSFSGSLDILGKKLPISGIIRPGERKGLGVAGKPGFDGPVELKAVD